MEYEASLIQAIERGSDVKSFRFTAAPGFEFQAGQFFYARLSDKLMKHFSFSNSPTEKGYVELTTRMSGSEYKNALDQLKPEGKVRINGPFGQFTLAPNIRKIAFLSGGIGITPIRSICKYATDKGVDCDIALLYASKAQESVIFKRDFEEMSLQNKKLKVVHVLSEPGPGWNGYKGYITKDIVAKEIPDYKERTFYICGPPAMVLAMNGLLEEMGVEGGNVKQENFTGY